MSKHSFITERAIAHRGLHDGNRTVFENTLASARRAIEAGYGIECDLQYAADAVPVVFHDDDMERLCNFKGDVRSKTSSELGLISVGGSSEKIPTFKALLETVDGQVPLIVELKGRAGDDDGFADSVLEVLEGYTGPLALMSFDHHLLKELKELGAPFPVGLTAYGIEPDKIKAHETAMAFGLDFISFYLNHLPNAFIEGQRAAGIPVITWTIRNQAEADHSYTHSDQITFELFEPRTEKEAN